MKIELPRTSNYQFDSKQPTAMFVGRWQPFHQGHAEFVAEGIRRVGQACILVRDTHQIDEQNPADYLEVCRMITARMAEQGYHQWEHYRIYRIPNATHMYYGKEAGMPIEKIELPEKLSTVKESPSVLNFSRGVIPVFVILIIAILILLFASKCRGQEIFDGCGLHGDAKPGTREYTLNPLKNRSSAVVTLVNDKNTVQIVLAPGNDLKRFNPNQISRISGYVAVVKPGGLESCNCHSKTNLDTHIAIVSDPKYANDSSKHVILEVTPRIRATKKGWDTPTLKKKLLHKWVTFTGFMFPDTMHTQNAANTNPKGKHLWRASVWELHPLLDMQVMKK